MNAVPGLDQQTMLDIEKFTNTLKGIFKSLLQSQKVGMTIQSVWSQMRLVRPENPSSVRQNISHPSPGSVVEILGSNN